jgi:hypothetical protein
MTGPEPTFFDHCLFFGLLAIPPGIMILLAISTLRYRKMEGNPPQLSLMDLIVSPIYFLPSVWFAHLMWSKNHNDSSGSNLGFACLIACCFVYQISGAALSWSLLGHRIRRLNWLLLLVGAYAGMFGGFLASFPAAALAYYNDFFKPW